MQENARAGHASRLQQNLASIQAVYPVSDRFCKTCSHSQIFHNSIQKNEQAGGLALLFQTIKGSDNVHLWLATYADLNPDDCLAANCLRDAYCLRHRLQPVDLLAGCMPLFLAWQGDTSLAAASTCAAIWSLLVEGGGVANG